MKIGILTFHSQLNYGGVLQCWALQQALKDMGHEVVVVDRWLDEHNGSLERGYNLWGWKSWLKFFIRLSLGLGDFAPWLRHYRTKKFVRSLGLSSYHFHDWTEAPGDLGVDCLVVGSDQVWHGGDWGDPRPYLLEEAPKIKAISYAASFGMKSLPIEYEYAAGFKRFAAISVREAEGVQLVKDTGYMGDVAHVVDPTLLLPRDAWAAIAGRHHNCRNSLVCYFLSEDVPAAVKILEPWARAHNTDVEIISEYVPMSPFPKSFSGFLQLILRHISRLLHRQRVRLCTSYGPKEFVQAFARADKVITDSFHAVMFSSIFGAKIRFITPHSAMRRAMFARVQEFVDETIRGDVFVESVASALESFIHGETQTVCSGWIERNRSFSLDWLKSKLA